jgi:hypothetical protein
MTAITVPNDLTFASIENAGLEARVVRQFIALARAAQM